MINGTFTRRMIGGFGRASTDDPYYVLGVMRGEPLKKIKIQYFHLAKQYHPDLNPDDERAKKMFLKVQAAFR